MLLAAKYEEIYPPYLRDFRYITDSAYTKEQIVEMEIKILSTLNFNMTWPTPMRFLERYAKLAECDEKLFTLSKYMLELSLVEVAMNKWPPSLLACSAIYMSKKILQRPQPWSSFLTIQTQKSEAEVHICAKDLFMILNVAH